MVAAGSGRTDVVKLLVSRGARVNARNRYGWTALMEAYFEGYPEVVAYLKGTGADLTGFRKSRSWPSGWRSARA